MRVGLTGGVASGKSTVSAILTELGALVIDADLLAREVVARGTPGLKAVVEEFGEELLTADGDLDRAAMGTLVFNDEAARKRLEEIVHPLVFERIVELEEQAGPDDVVVHDIPLLAESGRADTFDAVIVVDAPAELQVAADGRGARLDAGGRRVPDRRPGLPPGPAGDRHPRDRERRDAGGAAPPRHRGLPRARGGALVRLLVAVLLGCALLVGCSDDTAPSGGGGRQSAAAGSEPTQDPAEPLGWGPTAGELAQAEELVAGMSPEELAGQVIVGRYAGTDPAVPGSLVRDLHLAGVCVTSDNVVAEGQVRATTRAVTEAHRADGRTHPPIIGVDQEGGVVSHLAGIATEFPPFATAGAALQADPRTGRAAVREAAAATALELRMLGFTWVFAPVADVTIGAADPTIGTRSPSGDPRTAAAATGAAVTGYEQAGVVSTTKHFPGHGAATSDSHEVLPVIDAPLAELRKRDLVPFEAAVDAGAPAIMIGHLDVRAMASGTPSSLAPEVYDYLRDELGFEGVAITDSMGMGGVLGNGGLPAVDALNAGADLLLMPADTAGTHATLTKAIKSGTVERGRAEEAAARVVALQLWQQRRAEQVRVPADVVRRAQEAAAALTAAAY